MEEEEPEIPLAFQQSGGGGGGASVPVLEELPHVPMNEERAIVLFKPMNTPLLHSPSNFSVSVDSDMISNFKSKNSIRNPSNYLYLALCCLMNLRKNTYRIHMNGWDY